MTSLRASRMSGKTLVNDRWRDFTDGLGRVLEEEAMEGKMSGKGRSRWYL